MSFFDRPRNLPQVYPDPTANVPARDLLDGVFTNVPRRSRQRALREQQDAIVRAAVRIFETRLEAKIRDDAEIVQSALEGSQRRRAISATQDAVRTRQLLFEIAMRQRATLQESMIREQEAWIELIDPELQNIETLVSKGLYTGEQAQQRRRELGAQFDRLRRESEAMAAEFADATVEECRGRGLLPTRSLR